MSDPTPAPTTDSKASRRWPLITVAVVAVALIAGGGWYFFIRDDSPAEFDIESAAEDAEGEDDASGDTAGADDTSDTAGDDTDSADPDNEVEGTWEIDAEAGEQFDGLQAGFRVDEELANVGASTAVGRTPGVAGSLTIESTTVTAVDITVDMTQIETNEARRDDRVHEALATDEFPTAAFTLTEPIELGELPAEGETISVTATGEMTIKGITNDIELELDARLVDGVLVVVGSAPVVFGDYGVEAPSAPIVVSVDDEGTIEFQLYFTQT
ncbi:MAG: YceI family protein [Acidimicrobiales bacterium]|nr:YceI family protein [Acidimicrobiales bacterium]